MEFSRICHNSSFMLFGIMLTYYQTTFLSGVVFFYAWDQLLSVLSKWQVKVIGPAIMTVL